MNAAQEAISHKQLSVPNDLGQDASVEITGELKALLADVLTLYIKTKNFHWHMRGATSATITCCWTSRRNRYSI